MSKEEKVILLTDKADVKCSLYFMERKQATDKEETV